MIGADRLPFSPTMMQQQPDSAADGIEFYEYTTDQLDSECAATQSRLALGRVWTLCGTAAVGTALCGSK
jgi:hypothetical protein